MMVSRTNKESTIFSNIFSGSISALMTVIAAISYATLIFSGNCAGYLQLGITSALISSAVIGIILALKSSSPIVIAGPDANISAIIALISSTIAARAAAHAEIFTVLWISLAASSLISGFFLFFVGRFKLGRWIRFIPYPVVGGFLAGTGWLLARGSFKVMCGYPLSFNHLAELVHKGTALHWLPGFFFAVTLLIILRRFKHYLIMPMALVAGILISHLVLLAGGLSISKAMSDGWLLSSFPNDLFFRSFASLSLSGLDISLMAGNFANLAALMIVTAIVILLNAASVELVTNNEMELNKELTVTGIANILAAPLGALTGCMALSRTILNFRSGASSRLSGITSAVICAGLLLFAAPVLGLFPRPVLGGLLLFLGLSLLMEWVWDSWKKLSRFDYFLVICIIVIIALYGFLPGVGTGLVIACMLFAINYGRSGVVRRELTASKYRSNVERSFHEQEILDKEGDRVFILQLQGYIFFGSAYPLLTRIQQRIEDTPNVGDRYIILDFSGVTGTDSSSVLSFSKLLQFTQSKNITLLFAGMKPAIARMLDEGKCTDVPAMQGTSSAGKALVFTDLDYALGWCENRIVSAYQSEKKQDLTFAGHFSGLFARPDLFPRLFNYLERLNVKSGFVLFEQGAPSTNLYFVEIGEVTAFLELNDTQRTRKRLRTMGAGTVIGEMGLFMGSPRSATVVTGKESVIYRLSADSLKQIEQNDQELAAALNRFFICLLSKRLAHANEELSLMSQ